MGILKPLFQKNTALLLSAQLISTMGSIMQTTALALYVIKITGDALMFASVLAVGILPRLFGPFTGVLADRRNRKYLLVIFDCMAGLIVLCFAFGHQFLGGLTIPSVYCLVLLLAAIQTFYDPAVSAIIPEIADRKLLEEVNSASSFITNVACIAAPVLAGVIYAVNHNLFAVMLVNGVSFVLAAALESLMKYKPASGIREEAQEPVFKSLKEGLSEVFGNRELTLIIAISIIANLSLNPIFTVGMPYIMKQVLQTSDKLFGLSQAMLFVGPVIGSVVAGMVLKRVDYRRMLVWILVLDSALVSALALLTAFGMPSMGMLATFLLINTAALVIVATIVLASIAISTTLQKLVPVHLLGRVSGVDVSVSLLAIPLGQMLFGISTRYINPQITLFIFSCAVLLTGLVAYLLYKPMLAAKKQPSAQPGADML